MKKLRNFESVGVENYFPPHNSPSLFPYCQRLDVHKSFLDLDFSLIQPSYHFILGHHNVIITFLCTSQFIAERMGGRKGRCRCSAVTALVMDGVTVRN